MVVRTRITAAALAVALTAGLLACGGGDDNDETTSDTTEAGDTVIATMATMLAAGLSPREAVQVANRAAGIVVSRFGTSLPALESPSFSPRSR